MEGEEAKGINDPKPKVKKKPNWTRIGVAIAIIAVITIILLFSFGVFKKPGVTKEMFNISYEIQLENGSIIDSGTNSFEAGTISRMFGFETDALDKEIEEMQNGEEKTIVLEPKDAFGEYNDSLVFEYERVEKNNRTDEINRTETITIDEFTKYFNEQPKVDKIYSLEGSPWKYKVVEVTDTKVKISLETEVGDIIPSPAFFPARVIKVTEDKIVLKFEGNDTIIPTPNGNLEVKFTDDYIYMTLTPEIGQEIKIDNIKGKVIDLNETHLFLDANPEYAGEKITVKIILHNKYEEKSTTGSAIKISGAPTMQVFIMSYCPYGLQMLKGLLPVWEKFQDKANIELRFVSYTMHGQKEEDENYRMICIREEQHSKLIPYLKCYVEDGDYERCIKQTGIDESKLNSCVVSKASQYFEEDKTLNEKYGVRGSPTTVINGEIAEIWPRSPEDIKNALCEAFSTQPSECSEALSSENPSPGFGWGTSSQGGAC